MKRFTATWTTAVASAVLLAAPATGAAQTPQTATPTTTSSQKSAAIDPHASAQEHLRQASAALAEIKTAALPAKAKSDVAEIKRRVTALERTTPATDKASATGQANRNANAKSAASWGTEVAAIDKSLSALLGPDGTTPAATGTAGSTTATGGKAAAAVTLDAETRAALTQVRTHLTAYATAMAGGKTDSEPAAPAATSSPSAASTTSPTNPTSAATSTTGSTTAQPPAQTEAASPTSASGTQVDQEAARQHLTAARNTLSGLTQLPAAAQLSGEGRTQVAQLIANFNELISTQSQWRDSYAKVNANLTALLGPDPVASDPANASGTAGAVGTSGAASATIDPAVREKLVELRRHLAAFEKAATGGAAAGTSGAGTTDPAGSSTMANPPATATAEPRPAATQPTQTTGTTGTATTPQGASASSADVMKHVAAIEALLKMQDDSGGLTLTKAQVEQLRTHWAALRSAIEKK